MEQAVTTVTAAPIRAFGLRQTGRNYSFTLTAIQVFDAKAELQDGIWVIGRHIVRDSQRDLRGLVRSVADNIRDSIVYIRPRALLRLMIGGVLVCDDAYVTEEHDAVSMHCVQLNRPTRCQWFQLTVLRPK
jgi:hypothetical protein